MRNQISKQSAARLQLWRSEVGHCHI